MRLLAWTGIAAAVLLTAHSDENADALRKGRADPVPTWTRFSRSKCTVGAEDSNLLPGEDVQNPAFPEPTRVSLEDCQKECLSLGPDTVGGRPCAGIEWNSAQVTDGKAECKRVWGCTTVGSSNTTDVYQLLYIDPENPPAVSDNPLYYLKTSNEYRDTFKEKIGQQVLRNESSPAQYGDQIDALLKKQEPAVAAARTLHEAATAQASRLNSEHQSYQVDDPEAGTHVADAEQLKATIGSHDCDCAEQLYGSTTTTVDTSVAFVQAQRLYLKKSRCPC